MRKTHLYVTFVRCDIVTRAETDDEVIDIEQCEEKFYTGSVPALARKQAADAGFQRVKVNRVRWPGLPPMEDRKKVDVCPLHSHLVMTKEEAKEKRKTDREAAKATKPKKPRKRKPDGEEIAAGTP